MRRVEAPVVRPLVHRRVRHAYVVPAVVPLERRAAPQVRHPVVEDEPFAVALAVHELAIALQRAVHDAQRVEVVHEVEPPAVLQRRPVLVARHVVRLRRVDHRRPAPDPRDDHLAARVVPHHREVHLRVVRERHRAVERDEEAVVEREEARLDRPVAHPPLLRARDADDGAGSERAQVGVERLRVEPVVGEVVRRPVLVFLVTFSLQPDTCDEHQPAVVPAHLQR